MTAQTSTDWLSGYTSSDHLFLVKSYMCKNDSPMTYSSSSFLKNMWFENLSDFVSEPYFSMLCFSRSIR